MAKAPGQQDYGLMVLSAVMEASPMSICIFATRTVFLTGPTVVIHQGLPPAPSPDRAP